MITHYSKLHFMVVPFGFTLGSVLLCPVFLAVKLQVTPVDPMSTVMTERGTVGASLHVYSYWDVGVILLVTFFVYF